MIQLQFYLSWLVNLQVKVATLALHYLNIIIQVNKIEWYILTKGEDMLSTWISVRVLISIMLCYFLLLWIDFQILLTFSMVFDFLSISFLFFLSAINPIFFQLGGSLAQSRSFHSRLASQIIYQVRSWISLFLFYVHFVRLPPVPFSF